MAFIIIPRLCLFNGKSVLFFVFYVHIFHFSLILYFLFPVLSVVFMLSIYFFLFYLCISASHFSTLNFYVETQTHTTCCFMHRKQNRYSHPSHGAFLFYRTQFSVKKAAVRARSLQQLHHSISVAKPQPLLFHNSFNASPFTYSSTICCSILKISAIRVSVSCG